MTTIWNLDGIPHELCATPNWVCWRLETSRKTGKMTKVPYTPGTDALAASNDPSTWGTFQAAQEAHLSDVQNTGVGFMLATPYVGGDCDHVVCDGAITDELTLEILHTLNTYAEHSPSYKLGDGHNSGIRWIAKGALPEGRRKLGDYEMYDRTRFVTITGHTLDGYDTIRECQVAIDTVHARVFPPEPKRPAPALTTPIDMSDHDLLEKIRNSRQGTKFDRLYAGDTSGYESHSEADLALCVILAFWTGNDAGRMDRLFQRSGLMRDKWTTGRGDSTYGNETIGKAIAGTSETYTPGRPATDPIPLYHDEPADMKAAAEVRANGAYQEEKSMSETETTAETVMSENETSDDLPVSDDQEKGENVMRQVKWTARELLQKRFPEMKWAIQGILPAGLSCLHGRPKVGKSWLALQIAIGVACGGKVLGQQVERGKVLYLALEDGPRRLQGRLQKQLADSLLTGSYPEDMDITFYTEWPTFGKDGGMHRLFGEIEREGYELIVIDTLSRMLGMIDQLDLAQMTMVMGELQRAAISSDVTILAIDHSRKNTGFASSAVDDLMGSTGKSAASDALIKLYKEPGKQGAVLSIIGRDFQEQDIALQWDVECCCWQSLGNVETARRGQTQQDVLQAIQTLTVLGELATGTTIARYLDKDRTHIVKELANLLNGGLIAKEEKQGKSQPYTLNTTHTTHTTDGT